LPFSFTSAFVVRLLLVGGASPPLTIYLSAAPPSGQHGVDFKAILIVDDNLGVSWNKGPPNRLSVNIATDVRSTCTLDRNVL
jgi:hypothetical protein